MPDIFRGAYLSLYEDTADEDAVKDEWDQEFLATLLVNDLDCRLVLNALHVIAYSGKNIANEFPSFISVKVYCFPISDASTRFSNGKVE
jgi:hypothetical protein